jgi:hypothetical protein
MLCTHLYDGGAGRGRLVIVSKVDVIREPLVKSGQRRSIKKTIEIAHKQDEGRNGDHQLVAVSDAATVVQSDSITEISNDMMPKRGNEAWLA